MRKIRIFSVLLVLALVLPLPLTGCHGGKKRASFELPSEFDTSKTYEISFWAKSDNNKTQTEIYKKAIADFEALYPNIKVTLQLYFNYGDIYNDVITNIPTDTTPNVCITYPDHIATYATGENTIVPLEDIVGNQKYGLGGSEVKFDSPTTSQIIPKFLNECTFGGHLYAMPFMRSTEACYINADLLAKLGYEVPDVLTWDFIWEVSEKATEKNEDGTFKVNGQSVMIPFIYKSTDNMMIQMLAQKNAGYSKATGEIEIFNDTTKQILLDIAPHAKSRAFSTFKISSYPGNFLNAGQCIFAIDSTAGATWMGTDAPNIDIHKSDLVAFNTAVRAVPQYDTENPKMISQGPSVCLFNKSDTQEVLASWLFLQYLLTNDVQIAYSQTEGYAPVTSKAQNSAEYVEYLAAEGTDNDMHYNVKIQATKLLLANTDNTFITPVFNGSASLRNAAGELIEMTVNSERRSTSVDSGVVSEFFAKAQSLYRLDSIQISDGASNSGVRTYFGKLPATAVILLSSICCAWVIIGGVFIVKTWKKYKKRS